jgi:hypothetical protein
VAAVVSTDERFIIFIKLRLEFVARYSFEVPSATIKYGLGRIIFDDEASLHHTRSELHNDPFNCPFMALT